MKTTVMTRKSERHNKDKLKYERRKTADIWRYIQKLLAMISWVLFLIALAMSYYAAPDKDYGVLRYYDVEIRQFWLAPLTGYLYILLWLSALGSYLALITDKYRNRRRSDNPHFNLILLLVTNLFWLVYILVKAV